MATALRQMATLQPQTAPLKILKLRHPDAEFYICQNFLTSKPGCYPEERTASSKHLEEKKSLSLMNFSNRCRNY